MKVSRLFTMLLTISMILAPVSAFGAGELEVSVEVSVDCDQATFQASLAGGTSPYSLQWAFGDSETLPEEGVIVPQPVVHTYPAAGEYTWSLSVSDTASATGLSTGTLLVEGPNVSLVSNPFPPLLSLEGGAATVEFIAEVEGGQPLYGYAWDFNGDGQLDLENAASEALFTYTEAGKYEARVVVIDGCGLSGEDTLPVVVIDPDAEACHPMAQRIADAVNTLFPNQAETLYTCEDILAIFQGSLTGSQLGFGRLWHAYQLSQTMEELTWEEIRDWHLSGNGWGLLVQLDRFSEALDRIGLSDLVDRVLSGEASVGDIRHAVQAAVRYQADFEDALGRLTAGMSPGELSRLYRTAQDLGLEPGELDAHLTSGASLQELSHAARLASRTGSDWQQVLEAHAAGESWGAINQNLRGAQNVGQSGSESDANEGHDPPRDEARVERETIRNQKTASQLARQFGVPESAVWSVFNGACAGDWSCVRSTLRQGSGGK